MAQHKTVSPTLQRAQGCWNCTSWSPETAKAFWNTKRLQDLAIACQRAESSPLGEAEQGVVNIRRMVAVVDDGVAKGELGGCMKRDLQRDKPIGDLVAHAYLCNHWSGRQGASLAREGGALDKLPDELMADVFADAEKGGE
jgi:hypothetical protein